MNPFSFGVICEVVVHPIELALVFPLRMRLKAAFALIPMHWSNVAIHSVFPIVGMAIILLNLATGAPLGWDVWVGALPVLLFSPLVMLFAGAATYYTNPAMREPFRYVFDDQGVHVVAKDYDFTHRWSAISHVRTFGGFVMIFFSNRHAHCIPVEALRNAGIEASELTDLAVSNGVNCR